MSSLLCHWMLSKFNLVTLRLSRTKWAWNSWYNNTTRLVPTALIDTTLETYFQWFSFIIWVWLGMCSTTVLFITRRISPISIRISICFIFISVSNRSLQNRLSLQELTDSSFTFFRFGLYAFILYRRSSLTNLSIHGLTDQICLELPVFAVHRTTLAVCSAFFTSSYTAVLNLRSGFNNRLCLCQSNLN